ncbi:MAG: 4-hydroxythreonine-4-phosphate dehydrogenase PdxA [Alphaproteobacteria bacterium]|nr:4-hydroxythreonine-4-phosphate dehydrogenase PdxA [Alphaproteobacteria bacterium]
MNPFQSPIAITAGDPAGIGPEIVWAACAAQPDWARHAVVVGHVPSLRRAQALVPQATDWSLQETDWATAQSRLAPEGVLRVIGVAADIDLADIPWGQVGRAAGRIAADSVRLATQACLQKQAWAMVTAPIHKQSLDLAGVPFPGHTEMLQHASAQHLGLAVGALPVRMMLATPALRTVLVSIHVSLRQAIEAVTLGSVLDTLRITHQAELKWLGRAPRIAVAGLNPHAGEGGLMGREELEILVPAIQQARAQGIDASGPHAPDTVFMRARQSADHPGEFDVVLAMYHDQGLIPIKYLGLDEGINVTLGLPLVRTSPDHGTAFDLAGTGRASPASLKAAWAMARQMATSVQPD